MLRNDIVCVQKCSFLSILVQRYPGIESAVLSVLKSTTVSGANSTFSSYLNVVKESTFCILFKWESLPKPPRMGSKEFYTLMKETASVWMPTAYNAILKAAPNDAIWKP
jgi:hypothetical protein